MLDPDPEQQHPALGDRGPDLGHARVVVVGLRPDGMASYPPGMSTHSDTIKYDPASWATNRSEAGVALLGVVWSSALGGGAAAFAVSGDEDLANTLWWLSGLAGLMALVALTVIGCRLAFGRVLVAPAVGETAAAPGADKAPPTASETPRVRDATPTLRIHEEPARTGKSDAQIMVLLGMGIVLTAVVVVLIVVALRG